MEHGGKSYKLSKFETSNFGLMLSLYYKSSTNVMMTQRIGNLGLKLVEYNNRRCQLIQEGTSKMRFTNNRLTDLQTDKTWLGLSRLSRVEQNDK